jgi:hypothetical protein
LRAILHGSFLRIQGKRVQLSNLIGTEAESFFHAGIVSHAQHATAAHHAAAKTAVAASHAHPAAARPAAKPSLPVESAATGKPTLAITPLALSAAIHFVLALPPAVHLVCALSSAGGLWGVLAPTQHRCCQ